jgi:hypothetical protein
LRPKTDTENLVTPSLYATLQLYTKYAL